MYNLLIWGKIMAFVSAVISVFRTILFYGLAGICVVEGKWNGSVYFNASYHLDPEPVSTLAVEMQHLVK